MTTDKTVGEIAATVPQATRLFEKLGIDYCCGGNQALTEVCRSRGLEIGDVLTAIARFETTQTGDTNYFGLTQRELTEHIVGKHHAFTREEIQRLTGLFQKVVSVHGDRRPELPLAQQVFLRLADDLIPHMFKEENVLFPYITKLEAARLSGSPCARPPFVTVSNPVRMMMFEHNLAGELLTELRTLTSNFGEPADACISYRTLYTALKEFEQDLHQHIHLENNLLFPRAVEMEAKDTTEKTV